LEGYVFSALGLRFGGGVQMVAAASSSIKSFLLRLHLDSDVEKLVGVV
jgi:hypothetical protein